MKRHGILNRDIAGVLAKLGHTDKIVIADCGLPIPDGTPCLDVSLKQGTPSFSEVLEVVADDMAIEAITTAEEINQHNSALYQHILDTLQPDTVNQVSHEQFKQLTKEAKVIIRTGENTPYANIILHAGVIF